MNILDAPVVQEIYGKAPAALPRYLSLAAVSLCLLLSCFQASAEENASSDISYQLGNGLRVPGTDFKIGGYGTTSYENLRGAPARVSLDNLSLFVWWEGEGRWKFFSEFDYENVLTSHSVNRQSEQRYLALERLYFDYALTETTSVRVGKFLTPIGRWNLIHATPLVWTSSRPLVTTYTFPGNVTGLMVSGTIPNVGNGVEYSLYGSNGSEIRPNPNLDTFNEAAGGHLTFPLSSGGQIGFSYASFEQKKTQNERKQLVGTDFVWARNRYEISAEGIYRFSDHGKAWDEKGAFVQLVAPLSEKLFAVGRYEIFRKARESVTTHVWVAGLNYRITPAVVLKAEWIGSKNNHIAAPEGFMSSVNILF